MAASKHSLHAKWQAHKIVRLSMKPTPSQTMEKLTAFDRLFDYRTRASDGCAWFEIARGRVPVLVSAPHACMHQREGVVKMQEEYTGALAYYLAEQCGCHAIATQFKTDEDPNWQTQSDYKNAIRQLASETEIRLLIDLHGMTNRYHMGVALGTIHGKSCDVNDVLPHFIEAGFKETAADDLTPDHKNAWRRVVVDHPKFSGGVVNHTVTRFAAHDLAIASVQVELSSEVRVVMSAATDDWPYDYRGNPEAILATVSALESLVNAST